MTTAIPLENPMTYMRKRRVIIIVKIMIIIVIIIMIQIMMQIYLEERLRYQNCFS